ncbi:hypothetical protein [Methylobacterium oryzae]|uniref:hypothetical protein n=1 Tax=Methylobacterium oryzae TaxID=334852 RepID=UPI002F2F7676
MMTVLFFALMGMIKGGWHWRIKPLKALDHGVAGFFLDGSRLSTLFVLIWASLSVDTWTGLWFSIAWFLGNISSMGEEAGAIGRAGRIWGPYVEKLGRDREFGLKMGMMRGVYLGALLTLATFTSTPSPWFIVAGASFPLAYFAGSTLHWKIHKTDSWAYAEPIYYGIIGIAAYYWLKQ